MSTTILVSSAQRTYRYLRIGTVLCVPAIFISIAAAIPIVGLLPSLSHYFYSPARTVFTGALIVVSVCLFALSGHGVARALLDLAATFAPLIAIIPTTISPVSQARLPIGDECGPRCVPTELYPGIGNGVVTYLAMGVVITIIGAVLLIRGQLNLRSGGVTLAVGAMLLAALALLWWLRPELVISFGHVVVASAFLVLIAATALYAGARPAHSDAPRWLRVSYFSIGVAITLALIGTVVLAPIGHALWRPVLVGESVALILFAVFWMLQTVQFWNDPDPRLR